MAIDEQPLHLALKSSMGWAITCLGFLAWVYILHLCYMIVYNVYFHPLRKFPGPKLYGASHIPFYRNMWIGNLTPTVKALHDQYGDTIRITPTQLSFNSAQAWKDIYGHHPGKKELPKDLAIYLTRKTQYHSILTSDDVNHARMRKLLSHAFSDQALREQEPLVMKYFDLLIQKLHEQIQGPAKGKVDAVKWYNFTTFDIIGDLALGQPFGSLESGDYHFWISNIFKGIKMLRIARIGRAYPVIGALTSFIFQLFPKATEARRRHQQYTHEATERRLAMKTDRKDIMSYILRHNDENGMAVPELKANASLFLVAGSETTATLLSGATYYMLKNPDVLQRVTAEIRTTFRNEADITFTSSAQLPYLQAVIEESLRIYPPVPATLPRKTLPTGNIINGHLIPGNTTVGVSQYAASFSPTNFLHPSEFIPERWLNDSRYASDQKASLQPFSTGLRNCIGKNLAYIEIRMIISRVLWNFDMELCDESATWINQKIFTLWAKDSLFIKLTTRGTK